MVALFAMHVTYHFGDADKSGFGDIVIANVPRRIETIEDIQSLKDRISDDLWEKDGIKEATIVLFGWRYIP